MADKEVADLPLADALTGAELTTVVQAGNSRRAPVSAYAGTALVSLERVVAQLALQVADNTNVALFLGASGDRVFDAFDTLTYVDVAGATNLESSTAGILKPTLSQSQVSQGAGTLIGSMINLGGNAAAFDGVTSQPLASSARAITSTPRGYVGKDWGSGSTKTLTGFKAYSPNNQGWGPVNETARVTLKGSNSAPIAWDGNGFGGTTLFNVASSSGTSNIVVSQLSGLVAGAYRYHWVEVILASGANEAYIAEAEFFENVTANNLTVRSASLTAASAPTKIKGLLSLKEVDAATAETDYTLEFSRDGGTTWTAATLTELYTMPTTGMRMVETNEVSVAAQPSGTAPRWRFKTLNNKNVELDAVGIYWI